MTIHDANLFWEGLLSQCHMWNTCSVDTFKLIFTVKILSGLYGTCNKDIFLCSQCILAVPFAVWIIFHPLFLYTSTCERTFHVLLLCWSALGWSCAVLYFSTFVFCFCSSLVEYKIWLDIPDSAYSQGWNAELLNFVCEHANIGIWKYLCVHACIHGCALMCV